MFRRFGSPDFSSTSNNPNGFKFGIRLLQPPLQNWFLENFKISPSITSPPLKKITIFCFYPYKFFASCNCWFGMHLPQGLLETYPLGFYIISILASPPKNPKNLLFFFGKNSFPANLSLHVLWFCLNLACLLWHSHCLLFVVNKSPPSPLPNFFFEKKIHPPKII